MKTPGHINTESLQPQSDFGLLLVREGIPVLVVLLVLVVLYRDHTGALDMGATLEFYRVAAGLHVQGGSSRSDWVLRS